LPVKYSLPFVVFRFLLGVLLLAVLGSCSLWHKVHHPYRLPTPKPSPEYIAQQKKKKENEKLRNDLAKSAASAKKKSGGTEEAATDVSMPSNDGASASNNSSDIKSSVYPERSTVKYDKHQMMKKPKLMRRRRHNKGGKPFRPIESIRNFFKYGLHKKPNYSPDHRAAPKQPKEASEDALPDESMPNPDGKP
jgi:hypothetical protein